MGFGLTAIVSLTIGIRVGLHYKPSKLEGISGHKMEGLAKLIHNEAPIFEKSYYFGWRSKMKKFLKQFSVWKIVINPPVHPSNRTKKMVEKYNKIPLKFLMDGL